MKISELHIYPIKSMGGIAVTQSTVEARGFEHDRRWMLVDEQGMFLTQREFPRMALIKLKVTDDGLEAQAPDRSPLLIPYTPQSRQRYTVQVWGSKVDAVSVSITARQWFSDYLETTCDLVYMPDDSYRGWGETNTNTEIVSFADALPFLIIGQASLDDLNSRLTDPVPMNRFRPNIVVSGGAPYVEDNWQSVQIAGIPFRGIKNCARCVIPSINQETAEVGKEPNRTLATYRRVGRKIELGRYFSAEIFGARLQVGDSVTL